MGRLPRLFSESQAHVGLSKQVTNLRMDMHHKYKSFGKIPHKKNTPRISDRAASWQPIVSACTSVSWFVAVVSHTLRARHVVAKHKGCHKVRNSCPYLNFAECEASEIVWKSFWELDNVPTIGIERSIWPKQKAQSTTLPIQRFRLRLLEENTTKETEHRCSCMLRQSATIMDDFHRFSCNRSQWLWHS